MHWIYIIINIYLDNVEWIIFIWTHNIPANGIKIASVEYYPAVGCITLLLLVLLFVIVLLKGSEKENSLIYEISFKIIEIKSQQLNKAGSFSLNSNNYCRLDLH